MNAIVIVTFVLASLMTQCTSLEDSHTGLATKCGSKTSKKHSLTYNLFPGLMKEVNIPALKGQLSVVYMSSKATSFAVKNNLNGSISIALYGKEATNTLVCLKGESDNTNHEYYIILNISLYYCPPGLTETNGTCDCSVKVTNPELVCSQVNYTTNVFVGFCVSRERGNATLLTARCAFANQLIKPVLPIIQNNYTGETSFCQHYFHRKGRLCSECKEDYAVSVFSDTFECIPCREFHTRNLLKYLIVELLPTTIFFFAILFLHIGITTSATNGFIFFAQMITTPLEVLFLTYGFKLYFPDNMFFARVMPDFIINPYCIWNLTFYRMFHLSICLHPYLKTVHVLALRYISAVYPLILVVITYTVIELKARNIRLVTWLWRLLCFPCIRWRRIWKAKTSVIDAFASCILLSYTKMVLVSLIFFSPSSVHGNDDKVLSFDPSIHFLGREHRPYAIVAAIILITFGAFPPIVLTCYQFKTFKNCLHCLHLRGAGFQRFVDAFQGYYKDGTDGTLDCRFFAGLYFIFRCIFLVIFAVSQSFSTGFTRTIITLAIFLVLFAIFQPYKERVYNIVDSLIIFLFGVVTTLQMYLYHYLQQSLTMSHLFIVYYTLLYVPLIYMIVYVVVWLYRKWKQRNNFVDTPVEREPDFYRDSVLDDRATQRKGTRGVTSPVASNAPTHTEVNIDELHAEGESNNPTKCRDAEGRGKSTGRRAYAEEVPRDDDVVRCKPWSERACPVRQELEPITVYGSIQ